MDSDHSEWTMVPLKTRARSRRRIRLVKSKQSLIKRLRVEIPGPAEFLKGCLCFWRLVTYLRLLSNKRGL